MPGEMKYKDFPQAEVAPASSFSSLGFVLHHYGYMRRPQITYPGATANSGKHGFVAVLEAREHLC